MLVAVYVDEMVDTVLVAVEVAEVVVPVVTVVVVVVVSAAPPSPQLLENMQ